MITKVNRITLSALFIGSVLMISACANVKTTETVAAKTDETARVAIEKAGVETHPALQQPDSPIATEPVKSADEAITGTAQPPKAITSRIKSKEPFVNVRTAPSLKSRRLAVLVGGQQVEILDKKNVWVKVKWLKGNVVKQGWLKKRFVESSDEK